MTNVYFHRFRTAEITDRETGFVKLIEKAGINFIKPGDNVAVKVHFGEAGCTTYVKPEYVKKVLDYSLSLGGRPFLTDSNTLYSGSRKNGDDHQKLAIEHGFGNLGAEIVIADGNHSDQTAEEIVNLKNFKSIKYGKAAADADCMLVVSHFKGHIAFGFGGAIKNVGMGLGSRAAKQKMHADVRPKLQRIQDCEKCGRCADICPAEAVKMNGDVPVFDDKKCIGCAECIASCPNDALEIQWDGAPEKVMEKTAETCFAVLKSKKDKAMYYNFVIDVTPDCDCLDDNGIPLTDDIGVLASSDPVAIDAASLHLVTKASARKDSRIKMSGMEGKDKFKLIRPNINGDHILKYGEEIGLGSREYTLLEI